MTLIDSSRAREGGAAGHGGPDARPDGVRSPPASRGTATRGLERFLRVAAAALALALSPSLVAAADVALADVDRAVPDFEIETLDGERLDPAALAGKPWVINFWATWCAPCVEEMPAMNTAWETLEGAGVGMLAVNVGETREAIATFLDKVPVDFTIALGDATSTLPDWGARALPTTLVVDAEGRIVFEALGPRDWDDPALIERLAALAGD